jgi:hypothetical protein
MRTPLLVNLRLRDYIMNDDDPGIARIPRPHSPHPGSFTGACFLRHLPDLLRWSKQ